MSETIAELQCLTGWALLQRTPQGILTRMWSKDDGEDRRTYHDTEDGARRASYQYETFCRKLLRAMRP